VNWNAGISCWLNQVSWCGMNSAAAQTCQPVQQLKILYMQEFVEGSDI